MLPIAVRVTPISKPVVEYCIKSKDSFTTMNSSTMSGLRGLTIETTTRNSDVRAATLQVRDSSRISDLIDSIEHFKDIGDNWNGYGSEHPNNFSRKIAEFILLSANSIVIPDRVAPSAQGGIGIFFYTNDKYADIECFNTGEILGTTAIGNADPDVWPINPTGIKPALETIRQFLES